MCMCECVCVFLFVCGLVSVTTSSPASLTNIRRFLPLDLTNKWRKNHKYDAEFSSSGINKACLIFISLHRHDTD